MMINEQIRDKEIRLIDENGGQMGLMSSADAQRLADERNLDLVKIAPKSVPPVCKLMDYGKYRFETAKREKEAKKNQNIVDIKEVRLSATIDTHDLEVKAKAARRFLDDGDKIKAAIRFRGRQASHANIGVEVMNRFFEMISDVAVVEKQPKLEGRNMYMFLAAKPESKK